jgi:hypothetical protein
MDAMPQPCIAWCTLQLTVRIDMPSPPLGCLVQQQLPVYCDMQGNHGILRGVETHCLKALGVILVTDNQRLAAQRALVPGILESTNVHSLYVKSLVMYDDVGRQVL